MMRMVLMSVGTLSLGLGFLGIALPLVPATPFLLLAAYCFARSSPRLHNWLVEHRLLGGPIRRFREGRPLPRAQLVSTLGVLWISILVSAIAVDLLWARVILVACAASVTTWLLVRQLRRT
jgi:uncharacterized protein